MTKHTLCLEITHSFLWLSFRSSNKCQKNDSVSWKEKKRGEIYSWHEAKIQKPSVTGGVFTDGNESRTSHRGGVTGVGF